MISIHALLAESDFRFSAFDFLYLSFLSTLSLRRATCQGQAGSAGYLHFYPRSPCGERLLWLLTSILTSRFLSTLSLRRATTKPINQHQACLHFYPRSPCGERPVTELRVTSKVHFYPRSPCGERQLRKCCFRRSSNFYPRSPCGERPLRHSADCNYRSISIHALLAESDRRYRRIVKGT